MHNFKKKLKNTTSDFFLINGISKLEQSQVPDIEIKNNKIIKRESNLELIQNIDQPMNKYEVKNLLNCDNKELNKKIPSIADIKSNELKDFWNYNIKTKAKRVSETNNRKSIKLNFKKNWKKKSINVNHAIIFEKEEQKTIAFKKRLAKDAKILKTNYEEIKRKNQIVKANVDSNLKKQITTLI